VRGKCLVRDSESRWRGSTRMVVSDGDPGGVAPALMDVTVGDSWYRCG
jgi:hypothetical protein